MEEIKRYSYDNNGNQIFKAMETIKPIVAGETEGINAYVVGENAESSNVTLNEYDGLNQLVKLASGNVITNYGYNGDGLRTSKTINSITTNHIWDGQNIAVELDGVGTVTNKYIRGINLIASESSTGSRQYYLYNGHSDMVQLTGTDGNVTKTYDYDAFGNEKNPNANDTNVFRYCGEYFDKETGTIYLRARYYDPTIGRFITEDSAWGNANDPLSLNLYTYSANNPLMYADPSGHAIKLWDLFNLSNGDQGLMLWYNFNYANAKFNTLVPYLSNFKSEYFSEMNYWQKKEYDLRVANGFTDEDTYDYTYGGTYSGAIASEEHIQSEQQMMLDAFFAALPEASAGFKIKLGFKNSEITGELHHIASDKAIKSGFTEAYGKIFQRAGMSLQDAVNKVFLPGHSGGHTKAYKQFVLDYLTQATKGLSGSECKNALTKALNDLKNMLLKNPSMPYKGGI